MNHDGEKKGSVLYHDEFSVNFFFLHLAWFRYEEASLRSLISLSESSEEQVLREGRSCGEAGKAYYFEEWYRGYWIFFFRGIFDYNQWKFFKVSFNWKQAWVSRLTRVWSDWPLTYICVICLSYEICLIIYTFLVFMVVFKENHRRRLR